jgi:hypothetical protein
MTTEEKREPKTASSVMNRDLNKKYSNIFSSLCITFPGNLWFGKPATTAPSGCDFKLVRAFIWCGQYIHGKSLKGHRQGDSVTTVRLKKAIIS